MVTLGRRLRRNITKSDEFSRSEVVPRLQTGRAGPRSRLVGLDKPLAALGQSSESVSAVATATMVSNATWGGRTRRAPNVTARRTGVRLEWPM